MRGTTTAGETAPSTAPMTAASMCETPRSIGANRKNARISKLAGRQDIRIAGRPTFFKSARFRESPALSRMMISAICRRSDEMERMDGSSRLNTYGPSRMPVTSIPMILGRRIFWHSAAMARPNRKMNARDVNIFGSSSVRKKADAFLRQKITEVISFVSGLGISQGRTSFPNRIIPRYSTFVNRDCLIFLKENSAPARRNRTARCLSLSLNIRSWGSRPAPARRAAVPRS